VELTSAQTVREAQFKEKLRGYDPDEVDRFLDDLAAEVDRLFARLRSAEAARAEAEAARGEAEAARVSAEKARAEAEDNRATAPAPGTGADVVPGEGVVGRALVVAQRAADQLIAEAEDEARGMREAAQDDADRTRAAARQEAQALVADAEQRRRSLDGQFDEQRRDDLTQLLSQGIRGLDEWLEQPTSSSAFPAAEVRGSASSQYVTGAGREQGAAARP